METKMKDRLHETSLYGIMKNIETFYQRIAGKFSAKVSGVATTDSAPYEASKAFKANMVNVEFRRAQTLAETQRQNLRGR